MKRFLRLSGLLLIIVITGTSCHFAGRRMGERFHQMGMCRHDNGMDFRHMRRMGMRGEMDMGPWHNMHRGGDNMRPGDMGPGDMGPGFMGLDRIPNLTDDQRKAISDLKVKHMQEMDKLHEETFAKLENMKEEHRKAFMNILTPEQRKILESGPGKTESASSDVSK